MNRFSLFILFLVYATVSQAQITDGLIAWYPFGGNTEDASGNGHHGDVNGPVLTEDRFGNPEEAYLFDGVDDFISVMDQPSLRLSAQDYSISFWVKFLTPGSADSLSAALVSKRINYNAYGGYYFQRIGRDNPVTPDTGKIHFVVSGGTAPSVSTAGAMEGEEWHHIALVYSVDTENGQLFIDGSLEAEGLIKSPTSNNSAPLYFGRDEVSTTHFYLHGILDDIRIYGRKLSLEDLQEIIAFNPVTSVVEPEDGSNLACEVTVFPNPSNGWVYFSKTENCDLYTVRAINAEGVLLAEVPFAEKLSLTPFPKGIVFLEFLDGQRNLVQVKKVVY